MAERGLGSLESWCRPKSSTPHATGHPPPAKRARWTARAGAADAAHADACATHGVTISDHGEKVTWSGYWDERQKKLDSQIVDAGLFGAVSSRLSPEGQQVKSDLFQHCCIYFDGRVDVGGGLSAYALSKLARLHGATVIPRLSKRQVTHVVCSQLSGAKERHAMKDATSSLACVQYIVHPTWLTESLAAQRRFSLMAEISRGFGLSLLQPKPQEQMSREAEKVIELSSSAEAPSSQPPPTALDSDTETELDSEAPSAEFVADSPELSPS
ncbi:unnamed protein product [Durusdinium trenchii]|uniref:DNA repair protein REV1 n=2 Tax=Durusdinium trenchii TaxID=1381693 RepID=A0ABP0JLE4_9DINO